MKITYLHQYFNTPAMSGGTRSYEMARRLASFGHEVTLITSWRSEGDQAGWFETDESGIRVMWVPVRYSNHMSYRDRMSAFLKFSLLSARKAASLPADVVFATSTPLTIALPAVYASKRLRVPMVFEVRDLWPELPIAIGALNNPILRYMAKKLESFAYKNSERIIALSPGMRSGIAQSGFPEERITVIPNSADLELFRNKFKEESYFKAHPKIDGHNTVLYAGTLGVINGVGYLVNIARAALEAGSSLCFVVFGDGAELEGILRNAQQLGVLNENFFIFPPVAKQVMPRVLASASLALSLFVDLKPMWANSANKFFDALAAGKPIAINYGGWHAELLEKAGAGLRLPPDDPARAFVMLEDFLADELGTKLAGQASARLAEELFDRDVLAKRLEEVLHDATGRPLSKQG